MRGAYCLLIEVINDIEIPIGALGKLKFISGCYIYAGSALNGLEQRVARHLKKRKRKFWHIDYLLAGSKVKIADVYYRQSNIKQECLIADRIARQNPAVRGFGSSDCKCPGHLFRVIDQDRIDEIFRLCRLRKYSLL